MYNIELENDMLICPNPKCQKRHLRKMYNEDGTVNYECGACGYKSKPFVPSSPYDTLIVKVKGFLK